MPCHHYLDPLYREIGAHHPLCYRWHTGKLRGLSVRENEQIATAWSKMPMAERIYRCLTIADFNVGNFNGYLANDPQWPAVTPIEAPYGQVTQCLLGAEQSGWKQQ